MAKRSKTAGAAKARGGKDADIGSGSDLNDNWDDDAREFDERWLAIATKEKERSRIQRQMQARRELERRQEEKRLREMVDDWPFY